MPKEKKLILDRLGTAAEFNKIYKPDPYFNYEGEDGQDGFMETYSPHIERVLELANNPETQNKVWTIIDGEEDDKMYILAGYHLVNRVHYFITKNGWTSEDEQYIWFDPED